MNKSNFYCRACSEKLVFNNINTFVQCKKCKSFNFISDKTAIEDNNNYFDKYYIPQNYQIQKTKRFIFLFFNCIYDLINIRENKKFNKTIHNIYNLIINSEKTLEVGFGNGDELKYFLEKNVDIEGVDQSQQAINNFKNNNPQFANRVGSKINNKINYDIIYSNALIEHLDYPDEFITYYKNHLRNDGCIIFRIPMILKEDISLINEPFNDINFWKPCHRILFTFDGLKIFLEKTGFEIIEINGLAYYGYRVMNEMLANGFDEIMEIRNPYFTKPKKILLFKYVTILIQSFLRKTICCDTAIIIKKVRI